MQNRNTLLNYYIIYVYNCIINLIFRKPRESTKMKNKLTTCSNYRIRFFTIKLPFTKIFFLDKILLKFLDLVKSVVFPEEINMQI